MPALRLSSLVLQREGKDSIALLERVLPVGLVGLQGRVDGVESRRRRELVCDNGRQLEDFGRTTPRQEVWIASTIPFARPIVLTKPGRGELAGCYEGVDGATA